MKIVSLLEPNSDRSVSLHPYNLWRQQKAAGECSYNVPDVFPLTPEACWTKKDDDQVPIGHVAHTPVYMVDLFRFIHRNVFNPVQFCCV